MPGTREMQHLPHGQTTRDLATLGGEGGADAGEVRVMEPHGSAFAHLDQDRLALVPCSRKGSKARQTMNVELDLPAETAKILKEKASRTGQTLEDFLQGSGRAKGSHPERLSTAPCTVDS